MCQESPVPIAQVKTAKPVVITASQAWVIKLALMTTLYTEVSISDVFTFRVILFVCYFCESVNVLVLLPSFTKWCFCQE